MTIYGFYKLQQSVPCVKAVLDSTFYFSIQNFCQKTAEDKPWKTSKNGSQKYVDVYLRKGYFIFSKIQ